MHQELDLVEFAHMPRAFFPSYSRGRALTGSESTRHRVKQVSWPDRTVQPRSGHRIRSGRSGRSSQANRGTGLESPFRLVLKTSSLFGIVPSVCRLVRIGCAGRDGRVLFQRSDVLLQLGQCRLRYPGVWKEHIVPFTRVVQQVVYPRHGVLA